MWEGKSRNDCDTCPALRAYAGVACDELRELRQRVDAMETHFDVEEKDSGRRATGFHSLMQTAELKEMEYGAVAKDAETGQEEEIPPAKPFFVAGTIRQPRKGAMVAEKVRQDAELDLADFQARPSLKWTYGTDVEDKDLHDVMGSKYNGELDGSHSGYDTDLELGTVTGEDSPSPTGRLRDTSFEELGTDIINPPELLPEDVPTIFRCFSFALGTDLARIMAQKFTKQRQKHGKKAHIIRRPWTPDLDITAFSVPPSVAHESTAGTSWKTFAQATRAPSPDRHDPFTTPSARKPAEGITLPFDMDEAHVSNLQTPCRTTDFMSPPSGATDMLIDLVAEKTKRTGHRRKVIYSSSEDGQSNYVMDTDHEDVPELHLAASLPEEKGKDVSVGDLAAVWGLTQNDETPSVTSLAQHPRQTSAGTATAVPAVPNLAVSDVASLFDFDEEGDLFVSSPAQGPEVAGPAQLSDAMEPVVITSGDIMVSDMIGIFNIFNSDDEDRAPSTSTPAGQGSSAMGTARIELSDMAGMFDSDDEQIDGRLKSVQGPYTAASFSDLPADLFEGM
jgi:hypothetical protein